jgi:hypothetical protein
VSKSPPRIFISHRDVHRSAANRLASEIKHFELDTFVAHDDIQGGNYWRNTLKEELSQMSALVALVTSDFHEGGWCDQEVGFAVATGKPIVGVQLRGGVPKGFLADFQAVKGDFDHPSKTACTIVAALKAKLPIEQLSKARLLADFARSPSYAQAEVRFARLEAATTALTDEQVDFLVEAFKANREINCCHVLIWPIGQSKFAAFLRHYSNRRFSVPEKGQIVEEAV